MLHYTKNTSCSTSGCLLLRSTGNWPTANPFFPLSAEADSPQKGISVGGLTTRPPGIRYRIPLAHEAVERRAPGAPVAALTDGDRQGQRVRGPGVPGPGLLLGPASRAHCTRRECVCHHVVPHNPPVG